jgi:hypothetical protein
VVRARTVSGECSGRGAAGCPLPPAGNDHRATSAPAPWYMGGGCPWTGSDTHSVSVPRPRGPQRPPSKTPTSPVPKPGPWSGFHGLYELDRAT